MSFFSLQKVHIVYQCGGLVLFILKLLLSTSSIFSSKTKYVLYKNHFNPLYSLLNTYSFPLPTAHLPRTPLLLPLYMQILSHLLFWIIIEHAACSLSFPGAGLTHFACGESQRALSERLCCLKWTSLPHSRKYNPFTHCRGLLPKEGRNVHTVAILLYCKV